MAYSVTFPQRVSDAIGGRISRLGEWLGIERLIYNPLTFRNFHRVALHSAPGVLRTFRTLFPDAKRFLDVGAGSGAYAAEISRSPGLSCIACEYSSTARRMAQSQGVDCRHFDLTKNPPTDVVGPFDIAYSFEVAEHVPELLGRKLVSYMAEQASTVVFTAAAPGQLGMGHINCQPKEYWIDRFAEAKMQHRADLSDRAAQLFRDEEVAYWLIANVMVFQAAR